MNQLFARSKDLLAIVALVVVAVMCAAATAHAASSSPGAEGMSYATSHSPAASNAPCVFNPVQTCQSTNPNVTSRIRYYGDTSGCIFTWDVFWGDGASLLNLTVLGPADGYRLLAQHTYAHAGTYTILITGSATPATCTATTGSATFTLTNPAGEACVFDAPTGVTTVFGHKIFGHVGWGFELPSGYWEFGANEGPGSLDISKTWYTTGTWKQMLAAFRNKGNYHSSTYYTTYKCATVNTAASDITNAGTTVGREYHQFYFIPGHDCESQVYNVLSAYGVKQLPSDTSLFYWPSPNNWFNHLSSAGFGKATKL